MTAEAVVDESGRGSGYYVAVAVVANGDVDELRRLARSYGLPGQRRWHFVNERDSRRRQILDAVVAAGQVSAFTFYCKVGTIRSGRNAFAAWSRRCCTLA